MQPGNVRKTRNPGDSRRERLTFWPSGHPTVFPHIQTDHWCKMKTAVPGYLTSVPLALLEDTGSLNHTTRSLPHPPRGNVDPVLSAARASALRHGTAGKKHTPQNMPWYRNMFNDRARMGFCYWLVEKKTPACKGYSLGAYKTCLGLPKV